MKKLKTMSQIITSLAILFLIASCGGGGVSSNEYLGKVPGMAKKYQEEIDELETKIEECTDFNDALKLDQEKKELKDEANKAFEEYLAENPINNVPFEQKAQYRFTVNEVSVTQSSYSRIHFVGKVTIDEDILNDFGNPPGFSRNFFAYIKAVDKEGNTISSKNGVMMNSTASPFKKGMEVEINGSLDAPGKLVNFDKLVFVNKDD